MKRCDWCLGDPLYEEYHDREWGVPVHDDRVLFEFILLEGAQAGLSWITILRRREGYRRAFADFDPAAVAGFGPPEVERLVQDAGIIRHRGKIESAVTNARAFLAIQEAYGSFARYLWEFVDGQPLVNRPTSLREVPASTPLSERISKDLRRRGFKFVGPTIVYAYLQAVGIVNDHLVDCFRFAPLASSEE